MQYIHLNVEIKILISGLWFDTLMKIVQMMNLNVLIKSLEDAPLQVMSCQSCTTENIPLLLCC